MKNWTLVSELRDVETFAEGSGIRELQRLIKTYGGRKWRKRKGIGWITLETGESCQAELHWYEAHGVGKVEMKIKDLL